MFEVLGVIFVFILLFIFPRVIGGAALWYSLNAVYWPGDIAMPGDMPILVFFSMLLLAIVDVMIWGARINGEGV